MTVCRGQRYRPPRGAFLLRAVWRCAAIRSRARHWIAALVSLLSLVGAPAAHGMELPRGARPPQQAVASAHPVATAAGMEILAAGGNAFDAAVAVSAALAVVEPYSSGIGGGGFMLIHDPTAGEVVALDYRETAPSGAHRDMFLDAHGEVDAEASIHSALAAGVPGTVRGMAALHDRYGTLPWAELIQPAIDLAENGFELDPWTAGKIAEYDAKFAAVDELFREQIEFRLYFQGGPGDRMTIPDLASTLRRIAEQAPGLGILTSGSAMDPVLYPHLVEGGLIADVIANIASLDPVMGEVDR